jgi:hypothetical protein
MIEYLKPKLKKVCHPQLCGQVAREGVKGICTKFAT